MPAARYLTAVTVTLATMLLVVGCTGDASGTPPSTTSVAPNTTVTESSTPTTLSAKAELLAAYDRSWRVYADAYAAWTQTAFQPRSVAAR